MKITNLELKVIRFGNEDVIATSMFIMPSSQWNDLAWGEHSESDYYVFNGSMYGSSQPGADGWNVGSDLYGYTMSQGELDEYVGALKNGYGYGYLGDPYAVYDAYTYESGIYSKGASYGELYMNQ